MKHRLMPAAALISVSIAACGGGGDGGSTDPAPAAKTATGTASASAEAATTPAGCTVVSTDEVARAFGVSVPAGRGDGPVCDFHAGPHRLKVIVTAASPDAQASFGKPPFPPHQRRVPVPGAVAVERTLIRPGPAGAQSDLTLLKSGTTVELVLTDASRHSGSLTPALVGLATAATKRV